MHFQEYMVKRKTIPRVHRVKFKGAASAKPSMGVVESIAKATGVIVAPSNPVVSIGAILAVPGIRSALRHGKRKVVGISPIIGGKTVKGPADKLMKACGIKPTALGVGEFYRDFLDTLIMDRVDTGLAPQIEHLGMKPVVTNTFMRSLKDKMRLGRIALDELEN
jgi:LPPG:FO 2-phospho-L-lactate transferase